MDFDPGLLQNASHVMVFTGAGVSAESGISTFRDALTGLWERFDPAALASARAFRDDPALVWGWYEWRRAKVLAAQPNAAHHAIAEIGRRVPTLTVVTQNVDDLHERAGCPDTLHLHGSLSSPRCFACARLFAIDPAWPPQPEEGRSIEPPRCLKCNGKIRPGVVWFGETLPDKPWRAAVAAAKACDVFICIGTSGLVQPAAQLPEIALAQGAKVVHINLLHEAHLADGEFSLLGPAAVVLPRLVGQAFAR